MSKASGVARRQVGAERVAFLGDIHIPYQDRVAVNLALEFLKWFRPDHVYIIGDLLDFYVLSRFDKDPRRMLSLQDELSQGRAFFASLREACPDATLKYLEGNHEHRLQRYLCQHPELFSLKSLQLSELLSLPEFEVGISGYHTQLWHGQFLVEHGDVARKSSAYTAAAMLDKRQVSGISGHCFDEETEILTPHGWKLHDSLLEGDLVMTLNRETGGLEWNAIREVFRYTHFREMISISCRNGLDLKVTENHGLWVAPDSKNRKTGCPVRKWISTTAGSVFGKERHFQLAGIHDDEGVLLSDDQVRFLAWVMAEGGTERSLKGAGVSSLRISQSADRGGNLEEVGRVLTACGLAYSKIQRYTGGKTEHGVYRNLDAYRFGISRPESLWKAWVGDYLTRERLPKSKLWELSFAQRKLFLESYIRADGNKNSAALNSWQLHSKDREILDLLQSFACRTGYRTSVSGPGSDGVQTLTINTRREVRTHKDSWARVPYEGVAWCVSVPNGTLMVRRGGHTAITLNTHRMGVHYRTNAGGTKVWYENGTLARCDPEYMIGVPDWQSGFTVGYRVAGDERFVLEQVPIVDSRIFYAGILWTGGES